MPRSARKLSKGLKIPPVAFWMNFSWSLKFLLSPTITAKKGDTVSYADSEVMAKFHSGALNRDFTNVVLTTRAVVEK